MSEKKKRGTVFSRGETDDEKRERFSAGAVISVIAMMVGGIFSAIWMPCISRIMGPADMSVLGAFGGLVVSLNPLAAVGVNVAITTFVSHNFEKNPDEANRYAVGGLQLFAAISLAIFALMAVFMLALAVFGGSNTQFFYLVPVLAFTMIFAICSWGVNSILAGYNRMELVAVASTLNPVGLFAGSVGLALLGKAVCGDSCVWKIVGGCSGWGVGGLVALAAAALVFRFQKFYRPVRESIFKRQSPALYRTMLTYGGVAVVGYVGHAFLTNISPMIVKSAAGFGWLSTDPQRGKELAGFFSTAYIYASTVSLVLAIVQPLIPSISEAHAHGRHDLVQHYTTEGMRGGFAIVMIFLTVFATIGGPLIQIVSGNEYPAAQMGPITVLFTAGLGLNMLFFMIMNIFFAIKITKFPSVTVLAALAAQAVSLYALSYFSGDITVVTLGIVIGGAVAMAIGVFGLYRIARLRIPAYSWLTPLAATAAAVIASRFIPKSVEMVNVGINIGAAVGTWIAVFLLLGGHKKREQGK